MFESIQNHFSIDYMFCNTLIIYIVLKILTKFKDNPFVIRAENKMFGKDLTNTFKQVITFIISIGLGYIYHKFFDESPRIILNSALASIVAYDYFIKYILKKLSIQ